MTYPSEFDLFVYLREFDDLVLQLMTGRVPIRPEQEGDALVRACLLHLFQLLHVLDLSDLRCRTAGCS